MQQHISKKRIAVLVLALAAVIPPCAAQAREVQVLYSFTGGSDGQQPWAGVTRDDAGNLYGVATFAGSSENCGPSGCGTLFKLTPDGTFSVLHAFDAANLGSHSGEYSIATRSQLPRQARFSHLLTRCAAPPAPF